MGRPAFASIWRRNNKDNPWNPYYDDTTDNREQRKMIQMR